MHERIVSFAFLLLSSSAIFLSCILMASLIFSLYFFLAMSQSSPADQLECIGGEISAGVGQQIALALYGGLCICGLDADSVLDMLGRPEGVVVGRLVGVEADRVAVVVVMVVVGHVDTTVEGVGMSCVQCSVFSISLLSRLSFTYWSKGIRFPFSSS